MKKETFGKFVQNKRIEKKMTLRKYAEKVEMALGHLSDIENGNRLAPESAEILDRMIAELHLTPEEQMLAYDLAANDRNTAIPEDLSGYVKGEERQVVVKALRTARDSGAGIAEWEEFIRKMEAKHKDDRP